MMKTLGLNPHPVYLTREVRSIQLPEKICVVADANTARYALPVLFPEGNDEIFVIPAGEAHKNLASLDKIWKHWINRKYSRDHLVINLGGGMITDLGGLAAILYKRGLAFMHIPTSLLGMIDAAIGGKTAVNHQGIKNIIGAIQMPKEVWIDPVFLETLPQREFRSGMAEMIKYAILTDDKPWQKQILQMPAQPDPDLLYKWLEKAAAYKMAIVRMDPYEEGKRKILNFGHTLGHAFESYSLAHHNPPLLHGEAVALGLLVALKLSKKKYNGSLLDSADLANWIKSLYAETLKGKKFQADQLYELSLHDKKRINREPAFVLIDQMGRPVYDIPVDHSILIETINEVLSIFDL